MTDERTAALFFELFSGLPRQGPGDAASTLRALALVPAVGPQPRVLDYGPLEANVAGFRDRHRGDEDARRLADQVRREIDVWRAYSDWYGYEFFVMRRRDAAQE